MGDSAGEFQAFLAAVFNNKTGETISDLDLVIAKSAKAAEMQVVRSIDESIDIDAISVVITPFRTTF